MVGGRAHRDRGPDLVGSGALEVAAAGVQEARRDVVHGESPGAGDAGDEEVAVVGGHSDALNPHVVADGKVVVRAAADADDVDHLRRTGRAGARNGHRAGVLDVARGQAGGRREQRDSWRRLNELLRCGRREDRLRAVDVDPATGVGGEVARAVVDAERAEVDRVAAAVGLVVRDERALEHLEERLRVDVIDDERRAEVADRVDAEREIHGLCCEAGIDLRVDADRVGGGVARGDVDVSGRTGVVGRRVDDELHRRLGVVVDREVTTIDPTCIGGRRRIDVLVRRRAAIRRRLDVLERVVDLDRTTRRQGRVRREIRVRAKHVVDQAVDGDRAAVRLVRRARREDERAGVELLVGRCRGRQCSDEQQRGDRFARNSPHGPASHLIHHHSRAYVPPVIG